MTILISKTYFDEKFDEINVKLDLIIASLEALSLRLQRFEDVIIIDDAQEKISILYPIELKQMPP